MLTENVMDVKPKVQRLNQDSWVTGAKVQIYFSNIPEFETTEIFTIEILEFKVSLNLSSEMSGNFLKKSYPLYHSIFI